jgi:acetyl-CoA C-acetyltransferase
MKGRVGIVSMGHVGFRTTSADLSFREMVYLAASKAYDDVGIRPGDVDAFFCAEEDFWEGYSISDEYCNDQLGAILKPAQTIPGDFIQAMANGYMQIKTGMAKLVVIESHCKASNLANHDEVLSFAFDPIMTRPLLQTPNFVAGLEMQRYMYDSGATREHCAEVVVKNRANAMENPLAGHSGSFGVFDVLSARPVADPLGKLDIAGHSDGCVVAVLAHEDLAKDLTTQPVWIEGVGWSSESAGLESRQWGNDIGTRLAADMAYRQAGIRVPSQEIDLFEIDDTYAYRELMAMEALRMCAMGDGWKLIEEGRTQTSGDMPVNVSGGSLGVGHLLDTTGGQKVLELFMQLREEAGVRQIEDVEVGLAHAWRGVPTSTSAVAILSTL